ncbi:uncharacterized protein [Rutidosis leptorrhynchoides]|uniref:uncharacterized protein isoform X2 n=1 Tax=Rutidosis leptorrhynchoides TaxID=125765 RepID=UPI003A99B486
MKLKFTVCVVLFVEMIVTNFAFLFSGCSIWISLNCDVAFKSIFRVHALMVIRVNIFIPFKIGICSALQIMHKLGLKAVGVGPMKFTRCLREQMQQRYLHFLGTLGAYTARGGMRLNPAMGHNKRD